MSAGRLVPLCVLLLAASPACAAETEEARQVFARVAPSVVSIQVMDGKGVVEGQGSGVVVAREQVVTNCHVIENATAIRVLAGDTGLDARWLRQKAAMDLCLLQVAGLKAPPARLRAGAALPVGAPLYAVGNPLGFGLAVSAGLMAAAEQKEPYPHLLSTAPQSPGSSGGGVFDREGQLVGITRAILGSGQNLNMAVSASGVASLIAAGDPPPVVEAPPPPERAWLQESGALEAAGKWKELEALGRDWLKAQPTSAMASTALGFALFKLKRDEDAEAALRQAVALDAYYWRAWTRLAQVLHRRGATGEAEEALLKAEQCAPLQQESFILRSGWLVEARRLEEARTQIREAIRRLPSNAVAWRLLGLIEEGLGHGEEAVRALNVAMGLGDASGESRRLLTDVYTRAGQFDKARQSAQENLGTGREGSRAQVHLGFAELRGGRLKSAEERMRQAIALAPEEAAGWSGLGVVLLKTERRDEADSAFERALALGGPDAGVLAHRAMLRHFQKRPDAALADARQAVALSPGNGVAWRALGLIARDLRRYRESEEAFGNASALITLDLEDLTAWAESRHGTGHRDEALQMLRAIEAQNPKQFSMCLLMAKVLDDNEAALTYLERAVDIDPTSAIAWSSKGYVLMKLKRLPEAVSALETAVRLEPGLANPWINLGEAQLYSRNMGRSIQALEKGLALAPDALDARVFLTQAYLAVKLPARARPHALKVLEKQPDQPQVMGLVMVSYLMEDNLAVASELYLKIKARAPEVARSLRELTLRSGIPAARGLPE
ncbi:serine protease [Zoogloea sp.]|uniref:serine protease n=1 Tax=Zoogloea sp. TaxID=49181 RepID=UPI001415C2B8|nr:MAG: tetratricopeptide repeat protein [Zoogloea sp.]